MSIGDIRASSWYLELMKVTMYSSLLEMGEHLN